jgi:predicted HTH transcriptional regulator
LSWSFLSRISAFSEVIAQPRRLRVGPNAVWMKLVARDAVLAERQNTILEIARLAGRVSVEDLSARFDVTPQTIRKDLNELCDRRLLTRVHGGAILSSGWRTSATTRGA